MSEIERAIDEIAAAQEQARRITLADGTQMSKEWISIKTLKLAETIMTAELECEKNEPLTIEEILKMNGKPVWCQTGDGYEGWALVIVDKYQDGGHYLYLFSDDLTRDGINECFEPDEDFINLKFSDDPDGHFGLHVLGWRAYRYEPKGEKA